MSTTELSAQLPVNQIGECVIPIRRVMHRVYIGKFRGETKASSSE
jgi:hypothetical protein